jgi:hypothetical protein
MHELHDLYRDSVTVQHAGSTDVYGRPQLTAPTPASARVLWKTRTLYMPLTGKTLTTAAVIHFRDEVRIELDDRITLPEESAPRVVLLVEQSPDETGRKFTKVWVQ